MGLYKRLGFLLMSSILPIVILSCLNDMLPQSYAQIISPGGEIRGGSLGPSITLDRYGSIYVADSGSHKIQKFNGAGAFISSWGSNGTANGQFTGSLSITSDPTGKILVADSGSHKIQKFNGAGTFLAGWVYMSKTAAKPIVAGTTSSNGSRGAGSAAASGGGESSSQSSIPGLGF
jgi:hypothetical protein